MTDRPWLCRLHWHDWRLIRYATLEEEAEINKTAKRTLVQSAVYQGCQRCHDKRRVIYWSNTQAPYREAERE